MFKITTIKIHGKDLDLCPYLKLMLTDTNKNFYFNSDLSVAKFLESLSNTALKKVINKMVDTSILLNVDICLEELSFRVSSIQSINYNHLGCFVNCIITCYF